MYGKTTIKITEDSSFIICYLYAITTSFCDVDILSCYVTWECASQKSYDSVLGPNALGHHVSKDTELLLSTRYCDSQYNIFERCPLFWLLAIIESKWAPVMRNSILCVQWEWNLHGFQAHLCSCELMIVLTKHCTCSSTYRWRQQTVLSWPLSVMQYVMHRLLRENKLWKH